MALKTAYATSAEADVYLATNATWLALTDSEKDAHLLNATYYIDKNYNCTFSDTVEDEAGYACSILAAKDMASSIYTVDDTGGSSIVEKEVKAGSVLTKKRYGGSFSSSASTIDPYPEVSAILGDYCSLIKQNGLSSASVVRS